MVMFPKVESKKSPTKQAKVVVLGFHVLYANLQDLTKEFFFIKRSHEITRGGPLKRPGGGFQVENGVTYPGPAEAPTLLTKGYIHKKRRF